MSASWWAKQGASGPPSATNANGPTTTTAGTSSSVTQPTVTTSSFATFFTKTSATNKLPVPSPQPEAIPTLASPLVLDMLKTFKLEGSDEKYQTAMVFAKCNDVMMGGEDSKLLGLRWFRAAEGGKFEELPVLKPFYQPSVDDIDKRLCVQCYDVKDETSSSFVEYGPIKLDPKVSDAAQNPDAKVKTRTGNEEFEIGRSLFPPNLVVMRRVIDGASIEEHVPSWKIMANETKRVMLGDGRELEFGSAAERDIATLLVRSNPPRSKAGSVASVDESIPDGSSSHVESSIVEKQLKERVMELEAQLMATRARGGAAETGKALAEAQALRREVDRLKIENASLIEQIQSVKASKIDMDDRLRTLERELATAVMKEQHQHNLQKELDTLRESLQKSNASTKSAKERADKAELALDQLDQKVPELESRAKRAEGRVKELETKLAQAQADAERALGRKNAALQKAESLSKDLARVLKATPGGLEEVEQTMKDNIVLKQQVEDLRIELRATRAAYEAQIAAGKVHSAKAASSIAGVNVLGGLTMGAAPGSKKVAQLEHLANSLMNDVKEKDELIESQKSELTRLQLRLQEIQRRGKDRSGSNSN